MTTIYTTSPEPGAHFAAHARRSSAEARRKAAIPGFADSVFAPCCVDLRTSADGSPIRQPDLSGFAEAAYCKSPAATTSQFTQRVFQNADTAPCNLIAPGLTQAETGICGLGWADVVDRNLPTMGEISPTAAFPDDDAYYLGAATSQSTASPDAPIFGTSGVRLATSASPCEDLLPRIHGDAGNQIAIPAMGEMQRQPDDQLQSLESPANLDICHPDLQGITKTDEPHDCARPKYFQEQKLATRIFAILQQSIKNSSPIFTQTLLRCLRRMRNALSLLSWHYGAAPQVTLRRNCYWCYFFISLNAVIPVRIKAEYIAMLMEHGRLRRLTI